MSAFNGNRFTEILNNIEARKKALNEEEYLMWVTWKNELTGYFNGDSHQYYVVNDTVYVFVEETDFAVVKTNGFEKDTIRWFRLKGVSLKTTENVLACAIKNFCPISFNDTIKPCSKEEFFDALDKTIDSLCCDEVENVQRQMDAYPFYLIKLVAERSSFFNDKLKNFLKKLNSMINDNED